MFKKTILQVLTLALLAPMVHVSCQNAEKIEVSDSAVKMAKTFGFDYGQLLDKAKLGATQDLVNFIDLHRYLDEMDGTNHGTTTLELISVVGDDVFANAVWRLKPGLRRLLQERLVQGQARTKKEALKKSMSEWAPITWNALQGIASGNATMVGDTTKPATKPGAAPASDTSKTPPAERPDGAPAPRGERGGGQ
jgi:hypothetical protein